MIAAAAKCRSDDELDDAAASDFAQRVVWAGESVDLVRDIPSARDVIERIVNQAASVLQRGAAMVHG